MSADAGFSYPPLLLTSPGDMVLITTSEVQDLSLREGQCLWMTEVNQDLDVGVQSLMEPGLLMQQAQWLVSKRILS